MKRKKLWIAGAALAAALGAVWLWYARPLTLTELYPEMAESACQEITVYYQTNGGAYADDCRVTLTPEDPGFALLRASLEDRTYRRSLLRQLTSWNRQVHTWEEGDFWWKVHVTYADSQNDRRSFLLFDNFFGKVQLISYSDTFYISTTEQEQWLADVLAIAQAAPQEN